MSTIQRNLEHKQYVVDSRLRYFKPHATAVEATFAEEVRASLGGVEKSISPKFFYDRRGSELFEQICALPEYYLTRTEASILEDVCTDLPLLLEGGARLVELGSGTSVKTRLLLDALLGMQDSIDYVPIDVSEILAESSELLLRDYPALSITGIMDTYEGGLEFLRRYDTRQNLVAFLGSSYGNFSPGHGRAFLRRVRDSMKPGDMFLVGLDLAKGRDVLEAAYDDPRGVTARFNLNVLSRMNAELGADFDPERFEHHVEYDAENQRVAMYLRSLGDQSVSIPRSGLRIDLARGELIHTEYSHKYTLEQIRGLLRGAGLEAKQTWTDVDGMFSVTLARRPGRT